MAARARGTTRVTTVLAAFVVALWGCLGACLEAVVAAWEHDCDAVAAYLDTAMRLYVGMLLAYGTLLGVCAMCIRWEVGLHLCCGGSVLYWLLHLVGGMPWVLSTYTLRARGSSWQGSIAAVAVLLAAASAFAIAACGGRRDVEGRARGGVGNDICGEGKGAGLQKRAGPFSFYDQGAVEYTRGRAGSSVNQGDAEGFHLQTTAAGNTPHCPRRILYPSWFLF